MTARASNQTLETMIAAVDLSAAKFHFTRVSSLDRVTLAGSNNNTDIFGVLQNTPAADEAATIATEGLSPVVCGSSIAANALITVSASGRAITAAPGSGSGVWVVGRVIEASNADGDIVTAEVFRPWRYYVSG